MSRVAWLLFSCSLLLCFAKGQSVRLYESGWLATAGGEVYYVRAIDSDFKPRSDPGRFMFSAYNAVVSRLSDGARLSPVDSVWPVEGTLAISVPWSGIDGGTGYAIVSFGDRSVLRRTQDPPVAISGDGRTIVTSKDKVILHITRSRAAATLRLPAHLLGMSLSGDGSLAAVTLQDGKTELLSLDRDLQVSTRTCAIRYGSPIYGPNWSGETVAIFGSDTNDSKGLASIWLLNARTGSATNLHTSTVAVTATKSGFLALTQSGQLRLIDGAGKLIKSYGTILSLRGFRYDRGPAAYDYAVPFKTAVFAPGDPTSLAFDGKWVYALDEFGHLKKAPVPWRPNERPVPFFPQFGYRLPFVVATPCVRGRSLFASISLAILAAPENQ